VSLFLNNFVEEQVRPLFMVYQRRLTVLPIQPSIPPRSSPDHSMAADPALQLEVALLHPSTHICKPLESMVFLNLYL